MQEQTPTATTRDGYDATGNHTSHSDGNEHTWRYSYDADNRLTSTVGPDGVGTQERGVYDLAGQLVSRTDGLSRTTRFGYNLVGEEVWSADPLGRRVVRLYDQAGDETGELTALGLTQVRYDGNAREVAVFAPAGRNHF